MTVVMAVMHYGCYYYWYLLSKAAEIELGPP